MASIDNSSGRGMPRQSGIADLIVKGAIALVTTAFFIGAYLQFQVSFWLALISALSVYIVLLMMHALKRRAEREDALVSNVTRLEDELARLKTGVRSAIADAPAVPGAPALSGARGRIGPRPGPAAAPVPPAPPPPASASDFSIAPRDLAPLSTREPHLPPRRAPALSAEPAARSEPSLSPPPAPAPADTLRVDASPSMPHWPLPPVSPDPTQSYWPSRSSKPSLPESARAERREPTMTAPAAAPAAPPPSDRETDLDAVHGMIKRLADEVTEAGEQLHDATPAPRRERALSASLNALQSTANAMRAARRKSVEQPAAATPAAPVMPRAAKVMPPPIVPAHARLASLADAVTAGRVDVSLAPIIGLADHKVHYHEVLARPCDERGTPLPVSDRDPQLASAGLLPLLDVTRLRQAAYIARSFAEEGREHCVFASATAESLSTDRFLDELADVYRDREPLSGELVLTFSQADIRTFGGPQWSALTDMRDLGFRFGVEEVTDFDYEFTALCAAGFAFVKLDADALLSGLASPNGVMPAAEVCRNLSELGLTLIVSGIDDEPTRGQVLAAGVPLGQGALFGAPIAAAAEPYRAPGHAAA
jgi:cyclic-di-GMP phosphodiesterase TipF (flagellum assembly factor)